MGCWVGKGPLARSAGSCKQIEGLFLGVRERRHSYYKDEAMIKGRIGG